jgi:hypothetical protein
VAGSAPNGSDLIRSKYTGRARARQAIATDFAVFLHAFNVVKKDISLVEVPWGPRQEYIPGRGGSGVADDHEVVGADQDRIDPAEHSDRYGDLRDLFIGVRAGVLLVRYQLPPRLPGGLVDGGVRLDSIGGTLHRPHAREVPMACAGA